MTAIRTVSTELLEVVGKALYGWGDDEPNEATGYTAVYEATKLAAAIHEAGYRHGSVEQGLRQTLRETVAEEWAHMEELTQAAWEAEPGSTEALVALSHAVDWAHQMADEYDMGDDESAASSSKNSSSSEHGSAASR